MVPAHWYNYESHIPDFAFRWEEIIMTPRPRYPMPDFFRDVLNERGLMDAYHAHDHSDCSSRAQYCIHQISIGKTLLN